MAFFLLDIVFLFVFSLYIFIGLYRGFVASILKFISFILVLVITFYFGDIFTGFVLNYYNYELGASIASYLSVYLGSYFILTIFISIFLSNIKDMRLGIFDRLGGMIFCASQAFILIMAIYLGILIANTKNQIKIEDHEIFAGEAIINAIDNKEDTSDWLNGKISKKLGTILDWIIDLEALENLSEFKIQTELIENNKKED